MREKEIEKILVTGVKKLGGRAYKWASPGNDGVPDRIVILPGEMPYFVELKSETGRLSALQKVQIFVVKGIDGLSQFFQDIGHEEVSKAIDCRYEL